MPELLSDASRRVVGARQVLRAVAAVNACEKAGVRVEEVAAMQQLGKACGISVSAAVAALLKA